MSTFDLLNGLREDGILPQLTGLETKVLIYLLAVADNATGDAWPAISTIAQAVGEKNRQRVRRAMRRLVELGWLIVTKPSKGGRIGTTGITSRYRVVRPGQSHGDGNVTGYKTLPVTKCISHGDGFVSSTGTVLRPQSSNDPLMIRTDPAAPAGSGANPKPTKPRPKGESKTSKSSPHAGAVGHFTSRWAAKYPDAGKYPFNAGKDGAAFKWMLAQVDGDATRLRKIIDRYLADADPFVAKSRHSIGLLRSQFVKWSADAAPVEGGFDGDGMWRGPARTPTAEDLDLARAPCDENQLPHITRPPR